MYGRLQRVWKAIILPVIALSLADGMIVPGSGRLGLNAGPEVSIALRKSGLSSLIVYDGPDEEMSELMTARYIANLLGHFGIKPEIVRATEYSKGQSSRFSATFVIGSGYYGQLPQTLIQDIAGSDKPVCWLNRNIEQLLSQSGVAARLGFRFEEYADWGGEVTVRFKGQSLPKKEGLINILSVKESSQAEVLAIASHDKRSTPYLIRSGNFFYFADSVFSYNVEADRSLVFCEALHDLLGQQHEVRRRALLRIEDVNPESDPDQLRAVADILSSRGIPFQVALIPIYKDPARHIEIYLSDRPRVVEALKYMVSRGGSMILHGVTHQLHGNSSDDFEFWDTLTGKFSQDSSENAVGQKLESGMEECFRAGLFPIAWETPHYTASMAHYRSLRHFFSHAYDRCLVADDRKTLQYLPCEIEDIFGQAIIPENLGYISLETPDAGGVVAGAERMLCVRDSIASFFFHPFVAGSYLKATLDGIERHGYRFISAQEFGCSVRVGNYAVTTIPETVSLAPNQPFSRRVTMDSHGNTRESYDRLNRGRVIEEDLVPPKGGLVAIQAIPRIPDPRPKPGLAERIIAWWNETDLESIPVPQRIARRALVLVNAESVDARSFESFLGAYGIRYERVHVAGLERADIGDDAIVFVPRNVADGLTESGIEKLTGWLHDGGRLILEGRTRLAERIGFTYEARRLDVVETKDLLFPDLDVKWNRVVEMERFASPLASTTLVEDRDSGRPVSVVSRYGDGLLIYLGTDLDPETGMGYTRYPYLFHHLKARMRLLSPVTANGLEFYFDPGYRQQAPLEKLVASWQADGIRAVYAAAWHVYPGWAYDYDMLIRICHQRGIAVYAWFELPQVSDKLWAAHPEWRERTVTGKDGQVGWRKQMNLANRNCRAAALDFFAEMLTKHDWDGVNLAELSFDTRDGLLDPDGYVPMNADVRKEFKNEAGFDPLLLFEAKSLYYWKENIGARTRWEDYRTQLLDGWLIEFLERLQKLKKSRDIDCIVTALDSLHVPRIVEKTGTDIRHIVRMMDRYDFTLQVEDPVETWGERPDRYSRFAKTYAGLVKDHRRLMFDINVVAERESRLAPTRLPAGTELALTVLSAARSGNGRVAIYSEASLQPEDRSLLPFVLGAAAGVSFRGQRDFDDPDDGLREAWVITAKTIWLSLRDQGKMLLLDNEPWQCGREGAVLIPEGEHTLGTVKREPGFVDRLGLGLWVKDVTAEVTGVSRTALGLAIDYVSPRRAWVVLTREPNEIYVDGRQINEPTSENNVGEFLVQLPSGRHRLEINDATTTSVVVDVASAISSRSVVWLGGKFVFLLGILYTAVRARRLIVAVLGIYERHRTPALRP